MEKLLTIPEVAEILGISGSTAKIWASKRKFPIVKVGRLIRVSPSALQAFIDENTEEAMRPASNKGHHKPLKLHKSFSFDRAVNRIKEGRRSSN